MEIAWNGDLGAERGGGIRPLSNGIRLRDDIISDETISEGRSLAAGSCAKVVFNEEKRITREMIEME